jgi:hypothetical protein
MRWLAAAGLVGLLALGFAGTTGCALFGGGKGEARVHVKLLADQRMELDGAVFPADQLPAKLKHAGAGPETSILIDMAPDMPKAAMENVSRILFTAGFTRMMFVGPLVTRVTAGTSETPASTAP